MSTQQPEALYLADWLEAVGGGPSAKRCAALLREQHARITELESQLAQRFDVADMATAAAQGFRDGATAPAQPVAAPAAQPGVVYAELPAPNYPKSGGFPGTFAEAQMRAFADATHTLRASRGQAPAQPDPAYSAACHLATALFKKYFAHLPDFASGQAVWGLCGSTAGVISQIDNMVSGLVQPPATAFSEDELE